MKKILCAVLAFVLTASVFAGCGKSSDDGTKSVTLKWVMPFSEQSDLQLVQKEVNNLLEDALPNTKLELLCDSSMGTKWSLWMAGGSVFDIAHSGYATDLQSEINKKSYKGLNDLIDEYAPTIKAEKSKYETEYASGAYNGELYAIPNIQYHIKDTLAVNIPNELAQYLDVNALVSETWASAKTTEKVYQIIDSYFNKISAANAVNTNTIAGFCDINRMFEIAKRGYDFVGGTESRFCYDVFSGSTKIIDFYETEEFKTFIKYSKKWYDAGYISKDVLTGTGSGSRLYTFQVTPGGGYLYHGEKTYIAKSDVSVVPTGIDRLYINILNPDNNFSGVTTLGKCYTYLSIPATSENPERAIKLLELLRTEKGRPILNTIAYGIEGTHYDVVSEGVIKPYDYDAQGSAASKYGIPNWMLGNMYNMDVCECYATGDNEGYMAYASNYLEKVFPEVHKTDLYLMSVNLDDIAASFAQIYAVNKEFEPQLIAGAATDTDATYKELSAKLDTAGKKSVMEELQKQVDEFLK